MNDFSRRRVLQAVGAAGIGASVSPGLVSGHVGHIQLPSCDKCPPGTEVLVKYDWDDDSETFVPEGCDAVDFTEVITDEDDEPVSVEFTSSIFFQEVRVKTGKRGDMCDTLTWEEVRDPTETDEKDGVYEGSISIEQIGEEDAISFIAFCAAACFQVDFVFGESIRDLGEDDDGFYSARKILHLWGNTQSGRLSGTQGGTKSRDGCTVTTDAITADLDTDTASVTFDVEGEDCTLTLVSYVAPCPIGFTKATGDQQHRFSYLTKTFSTGTGHTLEVDLPTADDIGAICAEATDNAV